MAKRKWDPKDPADIANYWYNFADFLPVGVAIASELVEGPAEIDVVETDFLNGLVRARFGGGMAGEDYPMDCTVTLVDGQVFQQTSVLKVRERIVK